MACQYLRATRTDGIPGWALDLQATQTDGILGWALDLQATPTDGTLGWALDLQAFPLTELDRQAIMTEEILVSDVKQ